SRQRPTSLARRTTVSLTERAGTEHAVTRAAPPVRRATLVPDERRRNPAPALHQPGRLSPPLDLYPVPRTANPAPAKAEPPSMPPPYSPGYHGVLRPSATVTTTIPIAGRRLILHPSGRATDFQRGCGPIQEVDEHHDQAVSRALRRSDRARQY